MQWKKKINQAFVNLAFILSPLSRNGFGVGSETFRLVKNEFERFEEDDVLGGSPGKVSSRPVGKNQGLKKYKD